MWLLNVDTGGQVWIHMVSERYLISEFAELSASLVDYVRYVGVDMYIGL